jgi:hypothetical protein
MTARQMQISWRSPEDKFLPFSVISMKSPFGSFYNRELSPAFSRRSNNILSLKVSSGSRLYLKVPVKRVGSWGMIVIRLLRSSKGTFEMSYPSRKIDPLYSSTILVIAKAIVLLPAPVLPTIPIFSPPLTLKFRPFKTISVSGRYLKNTSLNSIYPVWGQSFAI